MLTVSYVYIILVQLLLRLSTFLCLFYFRFDWAPNFVTVLLISNIDSNTNKYMIYSTHRFWKFLRWLLKTSSLHSIFVKHVALFFLFKLFLQRVSSVVTRWKLDFIHVIYRHGYDSILFQLLIRIVLRYVVECFLT